jgi:hypothetical protein
MKTLYSFVHSKSRQLSLLTSLLFLSIFGFAGTFYISTTGNDATGNGSAGNPWRTLYKACNTVTTAGDIIFVNAGTYIETQQCQLAVGVSLDGAGKTSVLQSTLTSLFTPMLVLGSATQGTNGNQFVRNLKFDGRLTTQMGLLVSARSNVEIYNCWFYDFFDAGVIFRGRTDFNDGPPSVYSSNNKFHHNYMYNCAQADASYGRGNLQVGGQINLLIYNDTIIQPTRPGNANGYCIKNVNQGFLKGMKIYNNYLEVPSYPYTFNGTGNNHWDFATEFSDVWGMEYYNNRVLGSADQNFQRLAPPYTYSVYYHDNEFGWPTVQTNPQSGIILEYKTETGIFENNIFRNVTYPFVFTPRSGDTMSNITIQKNLAYGIGCNLDNQGQAIRMLGFYNDYQLNWKIFNNTFLAHTSAPAWGVDVPAGNLGRNISVANNIVRGFSAGDIHIYNGNGTDSLSVRNNNYITFYLAGNPARYTNSGNNAVAPNLNSAYRPNTGSPMIDAGVNVGLSYVGAAPDRGFAEFAAALPVKLTSFTVTESRGKNILQWKTENEINSDYFVVEKSNNGQNYEAIAQVKAAGNSSTTQQYSFTDATPFDGYTYYRLQAVDKDQSNAYSNVVRIKSGANNDIAINNALLSSSNNNVVLMVNATKNERAVLHLFEAIMLQKGVNSIDKNVPLVSGGIYYIKLITDETTLVKNVLASK